VIITYLHPYATSERGRLDDTGNATATPLLFMTGIG